MNPTLVTSLDEVIINVNQFNSDLKNNTEITTQLSQFRHWYYIPSIDMFGPSKYIGYKEMNTSRYNRGKSKTGIDTEKGLKQWFKLIDADSSESTKLKMKLENLLGEYNKRVNKAAKIHIPI